MSNNTSNINIGFKDCTFNNCTFNIGNNGSGNSSDSTDAIVGLVIMGGIYVALSPTIALGSVLAVGATIVKGGLALGLGSSLLGIGGVATKSIVQAKKEKKLLLESNKEKELLLESKMHDNKYISANYRILEEEDLKQKSNKFFKK